LYSTGAGLSVGLQEMYETSDFRTIDGRKAMVERVCVICEHIADQRVLSLLREKATPIAVESSPK
jgi:hypothetical protein